MIFLAAHTVIIEMYYIVVANNTQLICPQFAALITNNIHNLYGPCYGSLNSGPCTPSYKLCPVQICNEYRIWTKQGSSEGLST